MKLKTNKESRELLDEIREKRLWEDYTDLREVLGIVDRGSDETSWRESYLVKRLTPSQVDFNVVKYFRTKEAASRYEKKVKRCFTKDVDIDVKCGWRDDSLSDMFWMGSTTIFRENDVVLVMHLFRNTARFLFDVWEPMVSWADDLEDKMTKIEVT